MLRSFFISISLLFVSLNAKAQHVVENYSNADIKQLATVKQIADWVQFNEIDNVFYLLSNQNIVDKAFLNIESSYLAKEYSRDKIESSKAISITDDRNIVWYERNIYKKKKGKLKPKYQIYFTVEFIDSAYKILDISFGKKKKINTAKYTGN